MKFNYYILFIMLGLFSCKPNYPPKSDNWFATKIFTYYTKEAEDPSIDEIYLIDQDNGFLLGSEKITTVADGQAVKKTVALCFRSEDGGHSFQRQEFGEGALSCLSQSVIDSCFYLICGRFSQADLRKPDHFEILRSIDFGKTWQSLYTFKNKYLTHVLFLNKTTGIAYVMQDTIGYDIPVLYKTEDGGKTWNPTKTDMNGKYPNLITPEGLIMGQYLDDDIHAVWQMDINELKIEKMPLDFSKTLRINTDIQTDPVTGLHYCRLLTRKLQGNDTEKNIEDYLLCVETQEMIPMPYYSFEFNVYGNFIGVRCALKENQYIAQYKYSNDKGRTWRTETPKDFMLYGMPGMYGKGYIWSMCGSVVDEITWPLLVRIPPEEYK